MAFVAVTTDTELGVATPVMVSGVDGGLLPPGAGVFAAVPLPPPPHPVIRHRKSAAAAAARNETCFTYTPLKGFKDSTRPRHSIGSLRRGLQREVYERRVSARASCFMSLRKRAGGQRRESGSAVVSLIVDSAIEEWTDSTPGILERCSRKNASYALMSRTTMRKRKSVSPIKV